MGKRPTRAEVSPEIKKEAVERYMYNGEPLSDVARAYFVGPSTVNNWAKAMFPTLDKEKLEIGFCMAIQTKKNGYNRVIQRYRYTKEQAEEIIDKHTNTTTCVDWDRFSAMAIALKPVKIISEDCRIEEKDVVLELDRRMLKGGYRRVPPMVKENFEKYLVRMRGLKKPKDIYINGYKILCVADLVYGKKAT